MYENSSDWFKKLQGLLPAESYFRFLCPLWLSPGELLGPDHLAERYGEEKGIALCVFKPDYARYGKKAPLIRNQQIVDAAELVIAFWDNKSRGTAYTLKYAQKRGKPVKIITFI